MITNTKDFGMIGLGTMGSNLVLNMSDHGYTVAGYDKDAAKGKKLEEDDKHNNVDSYTSIEDFIDALSLPRNILLLVPAGPIVDAVISELKPFLAEGDLIVDCGNSHFNDTQTRVDELAKAKIHFMGIGVSGGELGARLGPSIMPGGDKEAFGRLENMLKDVSAKVDGEPCTAYMGSGAAGHYVKMVHNGIEYALMQLIAETYHIMKVQGGLTAAEMYDAFASWNEGRLNGYLIEITAAILSQKDDKTDGMLLDMIADRAKSKGTGAWTSTDAMTLPAPIPSIDAAVSQRTMSGLQQERWIAAEYMGKHTAAAICSDKQNLLSELEQALYAAYLIVYAQGLSMLQIASKEYDYGIDIATVASIWRGGCIIRAELLIEITKAYNANPQLVNLLLAPAFAEAIKTGEAAMRKINTKVIEQRIPIPVFCSALNYFDSYFSKWLPANMIQAQRDYFGAHTYERLDVEGKFHTEWSVKVQ